MELDLQSVASALADEAAHQNAKGIRSKFEAWQRYRAATRGDRTRRYIRESARADRWGELSIDNVNRQLNLGGSQ